MLSSSFVIFANYWSLYLVTGKSVLRFGFSLLLERFFSGISIKVLTLWDEEPGNNIDTNFAVTEAVMRQQEW